MLHSVPFYCAQSQTLAISYAINKLDKKISRLDLSSADSTVALQIHSMYGNMRQDLMGGHRVNHIILKRKKHTMLSGFYQ